MRVPILLLLIASSCIITAIAPPPTPSSPAPSETGAGLTPRQSWLVYTLAEAEPWNSTALDRAVRLVRTRWRRGWRLHESPAPFTS